MATITPTWTENVQLSASASLAASSSDTDDIDLDTNGYDAVLIQFQGNFDASATQGMTIEIFASPDSGTTEDTTPIWTQDVSISNDPFILSVLISGVPYIAVKRTNNDTSYAIASEEVTYAGRKWSSA